MSSTQSMKALASDNFADIYGFGWRTLGAALRAHWWFYVPLGIAGALLTAMSASPHHLETPGVEVLVVFPALAAATRLAKPSFEMHVIEVAGIIGIWLVQIVAFGAVFLIGALLAQLSPIFVFLFFVALPIFIWAAIKLSLANAFYTLNNPHETIFDALKDSWDRVAGDRWLPVFGLQLLIELPAVICAVILGGSSVWLSSRMAFPPLAALFIAALLYYAVAIAAGVWLQISMVAMTTILLPHELPE